MRAGNVGARVRASKSPRDISSRKMRTATRRGAGRFGVGRDDDDDGRVWFVTRVNEQLQLADESRF